MSFMLAKTKMMLKPSDNVGNDLLHPLKKNIEQRDQSLDALRGFAILAMVLSSAIAFGGVLPAWMYHAQLPPPTHEFIPTLPGITWVDLVFPFFLFSMGAAIPLSLSKLEREGASFGRVFWIAARRFLLLTFFALFTVHMRASVISATPGTTDYLLSILGFVLLCFQFYEYKGEKHRTLFSSLKILAFATAGFLLYALSFRGQGFSLTRVDVIILVLGNMAFFGTIIWWATRKSPVLRLALLPFVMAVFLGAKEEGSWNGAVFNYSPLPWMYRFYYLKYLFIILPGTLAGEWLLGAMKEEKGEENRNRVLLAGLLSFGLIIANVCFLFSRLLVLNFGVTVLLSLVIYIVLKRASAQNSNLQKFFSAGVYLLLLGLFFEAYEGGIKKDVSTYSYYFVTTGLSFFMLIGLYSLQRIKGGDAVVRYLGRNGRNPMVAYVTGNLLLIPLLHLTGGIEVLNSLNTTAWGGFLRGVIFTGIVSLVTVVFVQRKWFWKT
ncbi:MAG TPA: DUF5009 domain-containing protein [Flavisolibacter sp.]|jgi:predicted acyltransferase|nr:DUF5009 domain-containing protein [Flavisolibacter sp.]